MTLRTVLCLSTLRIDATALGSLFRETRSMGQAAGIQGAVVSDGERLAHVLHGPVAAVIDVLNHLNADDCLAETTVLAKQDVAQDTSAWPLSGWKAGWATPELLDAIIARAGPDATDAPASCLQLLLQCDLL